MVFCILKIRTCLQNKPYPKLKQNYSEKESIAELRLAYPTSQLNSKIIKRALLEWKILH